jgi:hypothetical protein
MARPVDKVEVHIVDDSSRSVFDRFTSFMVTTDVTLPSEAAFELGDDATWDSFETFIAHGTNYKVFLNDKQLLTGRVELQDIPLDAAGGAVARYTVRTKLADAQFASADPGVKVDKVTIKDFIVALYAPLGYEDNADPDKSDFVFKGHVARDLITGEDTSGQGVPTEVDLEPIKADQAKVHPPESIYQAADRHLRRHGLMHWDSPDGKIVISAPNDAQDPKYRLRSNRFGNTQLNNVLRATRTMDYSGIPTDVAVYGRGGKAGRAKVRVGAFATDFDVRDAGFYRPVLVIAEGIKTLSRASRAAARELSARSKRKDAWEMETDGLSYWNGNRSVNWAVDSTCSVSSDVAGGALGRYYLHRIALRRDAQNGDSANLSLLKAGIWKL